jgi:hypothetical protein
MDVYIHNDRSAKSGNGFAHPGKPNGAGNGHATAATAIPSPGGAHPAPVIPVLKTGRNLAHGHRSATQRAFLAADLVRERVRLIAPTIKQAAALARVSVPYVDLALAASPGERAMISAGQRPLISVGKPSLASTWASATEAERVAFVRSVGAETVWSSLSAAI